MIARALLFASRSAPKLSQSGVRPAIAVRQVHKGVDGIPPMRWLSVPQKLGMYLFICFTFLSYPTWVMCNLDNLRPRPLNELSPETQAALEEHRVRRLAQK